MKKTLLFSVLALMSVSAFAMSEKQASQNIAEAVKGLKPLAGSGVKVVKVEAGLSVRDTLEAVSVKEGYTSEGEGISWVGKKDSAWEADSTNFGETDMKGAYAYIFQKEEDGSETAPAAKVAAGKEAFKLLLGTGVKFGVAPLGAVQCGVTFAALAIIDPNTGKVYLFSKEGSGC